MVQHSYALLNYIHNLGMRDLICFVRDRTSALSSRLALRRDYAPAKWPINFKTNAKK